MCLSGECFVYTHRRSLKDCHIWWPSRHWYRFNDDQTFHLWSLHQDYHVSSRMGSLPPRLESGCLSNRMRRACCCGCCCCYCLGLGMLVMVVRTGVYDVCVYPHAPTMHAPNWVAEHLGASSRRPRHPFTALMAGVSPGRVPVHTALKRRNIHHGTCR